MVGWYPRIDPTPTPPHGSTGAKSTAQVRLHGLAPLEEGPLRIRVHKLVAWGHVRVLLPVHKGRTGPFHGFPERGRLSPGDGQKTLMFF